MRVVVVSVPQIRLAMYLRMCLAIEAIICLASEAMEILDRWCQLQWRKERTDASRGSGTMFKSFALTSLVVTLPMTTLICLYIFHSPSPRAPLEVLDIIIRLLLFFVDKIWYSIVDINIMNDDFSTLSAQSDIDNEIKRCQRWRGVCEYLRTTTAFSVNGNQVM